ncbi:MAG: hypothetical protein ILA19_02855 [Bacilli bacterium]|nr:hypothetical protein [Bacilli bacterium]
MINSTFLIILYIKSK